MSPARPDASVPVRLVSIPSSPAPALSRRVAPDSMPSLTRRLRVALDTRPGAPDPDVCRFSTVLFAHRERAEAFLTGLRVYSTTVCLHRGRVDRALARLGLWLVPGGVTGRPSMMHCTPHPEEICTSSFAGKKRRERRASRMRLGRMRRTVTAARRKTRGVARRGRSCAVFARAGAPGAQELVRTGSCRRAALPRRSCHSPVSASGPWNDF